AANQVNLSSTRLRLTRPTAPCLRCGAVEDPHVCDDKSGTQTTGEVEHPGTIMVSPSIGPDSDPATTIRERQLSLSLTKNLLNSEDDADALVALLRSMYVAIDERQVSY